MSFKAFILWSVQYCIISPQDDELSMNWIKAALPSSPLQRVCHGPNKTLELHEYNNLWRLSSLNSIIPECTFAAPHTMKPSLVKHWMDPGGLVLRRRRLLELWCGCDYTAESMGRTDREQSGSFPVCANVISTACTVDAVLIRRAGRCGRSFLQCSRSFRQYKREDRELLRLLNTVTQLHRAKVRLRGFLLIVQHKNTFMLCSESSCISFSIFHVPQFLFLSPLCAWYFEPGAGKQSLMSCFRETLRESDDEF